MVVFPYRVATFSRMVFEKILAPSRSNADSAVIKPYFFTLLFNNFSFEILDKIVPLLNVLVSANNTIGLYKLSHTNYI
jgi:hypothetical protein